MRVLTALISDSSRGMSALANPTIVLTPVFNAITAQRTPLDETVASDYYA